MHFNFRESFRGYSNIELLKIIDQADQYQPEAVAAARDILSGREVSEQDYEQVYRYKTAMVLREEEKNAYKEELEDFLESMLKPSEDLTITKWLRVVLIILGLQYLWFVASSAIPLIDYYLTCTSCSILSLNFLDLAFMLVYTPVTCYLLYTRKRWGWIFLLAGCIITIINMVINLLSYFIFSDRLMMYYQPNLGSLLVSFLVKGGFLFFLWKPAVAEYFSISKKAKTDTVIITASITLTVFFAVMVYPYLG